MYHLLGRRACHDILKAIAEPYLEGRAPPGFVEWKHAYQRYLSRRQPTLPGGSPAGPIYVDDPRTEDALIAAFLAESPLDDLERYRDRTFFQTGPEHRARISADLEHLRGAVERFRNIDPGFWGAFDLFINLVLCPVSRYSRGGSDSACIGVLYLSRTREYSLRDLYEILVHEFTHTAMFCDELTNPHYGDESLMPDPAHWARATISGLQRPLDKVIHSMVISTEILRHREEVLGHDGETVIHPPTPVLANSVLLTIQSLLGLAERDRLLTPRSLELMERCAPVAARLLGAPSHVHA